MALLFSLCLHLSGQVQEENEQLRDDLASVLRKAASLQTEEKKLEKKQRSLVRSCASLPPSLSLHLP